MLLPGFEYHRPSKVEDALRILAEYGKRAFLLAGGTDLLVKMKQKLIKPEHLVGMEALEGLSEITEKDGRIVVGPMLTANYLAKSQKAQDKAKLLSLAGSVLGGEQVRNRATLGGNIVNARPAADLCVALLALNGEVELTSLDQVRSVKLVDFFTGPGETVKTPQEILTGLSFEKPQGAYGCGYFKLGLRKAMEIALVNVGAYLELAQDGTIKKAGVSLGACAPTPVLSQKAEKALLNAKPGPQVFENAAKLAVQDTKPIDDHRGTAWYRGQMVEVLANRALNQAWQQAMAS